MRDMPIRKQQLPQKYPAVKHWGGGSVCIFFRTVSDSMLGNLRTSPPSNIIYTTATGLNLRFAGGDVVSFEFGHS